MSYATPFASTGPYSGVQTEGSHSDRQLVALARCFVGAGTSGTRRTSDHHSPADGVPGELSEVDAR